MGTSDKIINRWLVVVGAILIQLCLGAIYAWSVFTPYLTDQANSFKFNQTQTQAIFSVGLAAFALVMVFAGKWQAKSGPRKVAMAGGIMLGLGYVLGGLLGQSFIAQVIFIGLIGGAGIGLGYVCPISVGMKWFPDKKGLITGLAVAGFGFGALIWVKLADNWGHLLENFGVLKVFLFYGIAFAVLVLVGSIWMVNPPEGWKPKGWVPPEPKKGKAVAAGDFKPSDMLRRPQFYGLWVMFIFSSMPGLMTIGIIKSFGIDILKERGGLPAEQASVIAGTAIAIFFSLANGIGRIIWGTVSDKIGRKISLFIMTLTQGIMMLLFYYAMSGNQYLLYLGATIIGFNFGGNFALFPTATADFFGTKNVGQNYPWVFTAYGIGGIIGPIMAGITKDISGGWLYAFVISGIACIVAAIIALTLKPPKPLVSNQ